MGETVEIDGGGIATPDDLSEVMDSLPPATASIRIDVVSDVVCPWCYLGKKRLEGALRMVPEIEALVRWRPFQLDPTVPPGGLDRSDYLVRKFGSLEAIRPVHDRLEKLGQAEGIDFRFDDMPRAAHTIDAHRLIRWAERSGRSDAMLDRLFKANFTDSLDIGDQSVLVRLAGEIGLDTDVLAPWLASDVDRAVVRAEIDEAYRIGVNGVPCFILAGRYAVMGAQEAETLAKAIRSVADEIARAPEPATAG